MDSNICNIDVKGRLLRYNTFVGTLVIICISSLLLYFLNLQTYSKFLIFPIFIATISYLQYKEHFCVGLTFTARDDKYRHILKASRISVLSIILSVLLTTILYQILNYPM